MLGIVAQRFQRRRMDRDQSILPELGPPDLQDAAREVDVGAVEAESFARSQASAGQQPNQRRQHNCPHRVARRHAAACRDQRSEFVIAQDAWRWNRTGSRQRLGVEHLGPWIVDREILRKATGNTMPNGAAIGRSVPRENKVQRCLPRQRAVDPFGLDVPDHGMQDRGLLVERIAERPAKGDIGLDLAAERAVEAAHGTPPGNGRATSASCGTATFT
jgi:hypothetical protein